MGMILSLPYPPTGNHATRHAGGRHYLTPEVRAYRIMVDSIVQARRITPVAPKVPCKVVAEIHHPDNRRRDMDNTWKTLADALTMAGVWADDSQVADLRLVRMAPRPGGMVVVNIEEVAQ